MSHSAGGDGVMIWWVGTSGFSYDEWVGTFYPDDLATKDRLSFYASRLPAVEINNTFYRMPKTSVLEGWAAQVPGRFRFVLKASQKITHIKRLKAEAADETAYLLRTAAVLGDRLGPILFQMPPNLKKDLERLEAFLAFLPDGTRAAFEFRHESWKDEAAYALLRGRNLAWCVADVDEEPEPEVPATADWGYLRLRRTAYDDAALTRWADRARAAGWKESFLFFKHEDEGTGPKLAARFLEVADSA
jgi:uncharacterized protein YecE (DUF72 family)